MKKVLTAVTITIILFSTVLALYFSYHSLNKQSGQAKYIPVLMYHHFEEEITNYPTITVTPETFKEQLEALIDHGYEAITEHDLLLFLQGDLENLPEKPILLTIDDGFLSNYEIAYPILKEYEMRATIYVVTNRLGRSRLDIPHFTWDHAREMYASGLIDIQSHSYDAHFRVNDEPGQEALITKLIIDGIEESDEAYILRVHEELKRSKEDIEREIGNSVIAFATPYGATNAAVLNIAQETGYSLVLSTIHGINFTNEDPYEIKRININENISGADLIERIERYIPEDL